MGYKNREIEVKLLATSYVSLHHVNQIVESWVSDFHPEYSYIYGDASDLYWKTPKASEGDFVRLRRTNSRAQITMKATDRGDITDRKEIDLEIDDYNQAKILMYGVHGEPLSSVRKRYHVYFLENEDTTVSVYQIFKDDKVMIELEARDEKRVRDMVLSLHESYPNLGLKWLRSSVFNMFVENKEPKSRPVESYLWRQIYDN